jgi:hypothetical protein
MTAPKNNDARRLRLFAWGGAATLILLPLLAIMVVDASAWQMGDLPFALIIVAAVGIAFELALRIPTNWTRRATADGVLRRPLARLGPAAPSPRPRVE